MDNGLIDLEKVRTEFANQGISSKPTNDRVVLHDLDTEIPEGLPQPSLWRCLAMPVSLIKQTRGGIILPDDTMDAQAWHHQLYKIAAVGPQVMQGPAYQDYIIADHEIPKVGQLWLIDPKQPRRFGYKDMNFIIVNDDQLLCRVTDEEAVDHLRFFGFNLG